MLVRLLYGCLWSVPAAVGAIHPSGIYINQKSALLFVEQPRLTELAGTGIRHASWSSSRPAFEMHKGRHPAWSTRRIATNKAASSFETSRDSVTPSCIKLLATANAADGHASSKKMTAATTGAVHNLFDMYTPANRCHRRATRAWVISLVFRPAKKDPDRRRDYPRPGRRHRQRPEENWSRIAGSD